MAFIPDQAIKDANEISGKAFRLFCFYCKYGGIKNNIVSVRLKTVAEALFNGNKHNAAAYQRELKTAGWISVDARKQITLLKGDFDPNGARERKPKAELLVTVTIIPKVLNSNTRDSKEVLNHNTRGVKSQHLHNKEYNQPINQPKKKNNSDELFQKEKIPSGKTKTQEPKGTRIPEDLQLTDAHREFLLKKNPHRDAEELFEAFKDHWLQSAKPDAQKADWMAAWRTWCRKDVDFNGLAPAKRHERENRNGNNHSRNTGAGNDFGFAKNGAASNGNGNNEPASSPDARTDARNKKFRANPTII